MSRQIGPAKYKNAFRKELFESQEGMCYWCGTPMSLTNRHQNGQPASDFGTFEHLIPAKDGGEMNHANIVLAHRKCNYQRNRYDQEHDNIIAELDKRYANRRFNKTSSNT